MTNARRRIEKMQTTLMKLISQLESCKMVLDDIRKGEQTDEQNDKPPCLAPCEPICCDDCPFKEEVTA